MSERKHPPKLVLGPLSGRIYIATRYTVRDNGVIESHEKYDVTSDFMNVYADAVARFDYTPVSPSGKGHGE
jgi:hypothetical protein